MPWDSERTALQKLRFLEDKVDCDRDEQKMSVSSLGSVMAALSIVHCLCVFSKLKMEFCAYCLTTVTALYACYVRVTIRRDRILFNIVKMGDLRTKAGRQTDEFIG